MDGHSIAVVLHFVYTYFSHTCTSNPCMPVHLQGSAASVPGTPADLSREVQVSSLGDIWRQGSRAEMTI